jgi:hypothetical protein
MGLPDPLSTVGGFAGLVALAQVLIPLCNNFCRNAHEYPRDWSEVVNEGRSLCAVLHAIYPLLEKLEGLRTSQDETAQVFDG